MCFDHFNLLPSSPFVLRKELAHWLDWQGKLLASTLETCTDVQPPQMKKVG
jgi:hypothetical protein